MTKTNDDKGRATHLDHGGRLRALSELTGVPERDILDFSANLSPLGPPPWLAEAIAEGTERVTAYPDPDAERARAAAAARFSRPSDEFLFADGADSIIFATPRALGVRSVVCVSPTYSGYLRAASHAGIAPTLVPLRAEDGFAPDEDEIARAVRSAPGPVLACVGAPNNPAGGFLPDGALERLARARSDLWILFDESFAELAGRGDENVSRAQRNVIVARSLTKTYAVPGARVGFAAAAPDIARALREELPAWPVSSFGEAIAVRALADRAWAERGASFVADARAGFVDGLRALPGLDVFPGPANFVLVRFARADGAAAASRALLAAGIATRSFSPREGLDGRYLRLAVRTPEDNARFLRALRDAMPARRGASA